MDVCALLDTRTQKKGTLNDLSVVFFFRKAHFVFRSRRDSRHPIPNILRDYDFQLCVYLCFCLHGHREICAACLPPIQWFKDADNPRKTHNRSVFVCVTCVGYTKLATSFFVLICVCVVLSRPSFVRFVIIM